MIFCEFSVGFRDNSTINLDSSEQNDSNSNQNQSFSRSFASTTPLCLRRRNTTQRRLQIARIAKEQDSFVPNAKCVMSVMDSNAFSAKRLDTPRSLLQNAHFVEAVDITVLLVIQMKPFLQVKCYRNGQRTTTPDTRMRIHFCTYNYLKNTSFDDSTQRTNFEFQISLIKCV